MKPARAPLRSLPPRIQTLDISAAKVPQGGSPDPFYQSAEWRALVAEIKAERGNRCEDPDHDQAQPREGVRIYGDHVDELKDGGAPLDKRNVLLRCPSCHARKTLAARARRMRA